MDLDSARKDLVVAAAAGVSTVLLTVVLRFVFDASTNALIQLSPLYVYFIYLFFGDAIPGELFSKPLPWVGITLSTAIGAVALTVF